MLGSVTKVLLKTYFIFFPLVGQYDGRSKPLPEYHAKITGFDERVGVFSVSGLIVWVCGFWSVC